MSGCGQSGPPWWGHDPQDLNKGLERKDGVVCISSPFCSSPCCCLPPAPPQSSQHINKNTTQCFRRGATGWTKATCLSSSRPKITHIFFSSYRNCRNYSMWERNQEPIVQSSQSQSTGLTVQRVNAQVVLAYMFPALSLDEASVNLSYPSVDLRCSNLPPLCWEIHTRSFELKRSHGV